VHRGHDVQVERRLKLDGEARVASALPVLFFDVTIVEKCDVWGVRAKVREEPIAQLAVRDEHGIDISRLNQVTEESRIVRQPQEV
jgi:hypothetical protein